MAKELKIFTLSGVVKKEGCRIIIAETCQRASIERIGCSEVYFLRNGRESEDERDREVAVSSPGAPFIKRFTEGGGVEYVKLSDYIERDGGEIPSAFDLIEEIKVLNCEQYVHDMWEITMAAYAEGTDLYSAKSVSVMAKNRGAAIKRAKEKYEEKMKNIVIG